MSLLQNKHAIITGATRGIGRKILEHYMQEGAKVLFCSRNEDDVQTLCQELDPTNSVLFGLKCDLSDPQQCEGLIKRGIELFGEIDVLINNAGIYGPVGPLELNDPQAWLGAIQTNLLSAVYTSHYVIPHMKQRGSGKIINLAGAGVGGSVPLARFSSYYTSKVSVVGFTEVLASELKEYGIQVNCIAPGAVNTYLTDYLLKQDKELVGEEFYAKNMKQKSSGGDSPVLAANLAVFLGTSDSNHITGKLISAKWDDINKMISANPLPDNLYNLRRIDNVFFYGK